MPSKEHGVSGDSLDRHEGADGTLEWPGQQSNSGRGQQLSLGGGGGKAGDKARPPREPGDSEHS